jgi:hypothetical protein
MKLARVRTREKQDAERVRKRFPSWGRTWRFSLKLDIFEYLGLLICGRWMAGEVACWPLLWLCVDGIARLFFAVEGPERCEVACWPPLWLCVDGIARLFFAVDGPERCAKEDFDGNSHDRISNSLLGLVPAAPLPRADFSRLDSPSSIRPLLSRGYLFPDFRLHAARPCCRAAKPGPPNIPLSARGHLSTLATLG